MQFKQKCGYKSYIYIFNMTWLVSAFTLVGLNRLPPEQVQHLEPSQPTFADPEQGHTKWQSQSWFRRRRSTTWGPDSAAWSSLIVLAHVFSCPPTRFRQLRREMGGEYIADELSLWASSCVSEQSETALEQDGWKRTEVQATT